MNTGSEECCVYKERAKWHCLKRRGCIQFIFWDSLSLCGKIKDNKDRVNDRLVPHLCSRGLSRKYLRDTLLSSLIASMTHVIPDVWSVENDSVTLVLQCVKVLVAWANKLPVSTPFWCDNSRSCSWNMFELTKTANPTTTRSSFRCYFFKIFHHNYKNKCKTTNTLEEWMSKHVQYASILNLTNVTNAKIFQSHLLPEVGTEAHRLHIPILCNASIFS